MTTSEIQVSGVWQGRHEDNRLKFLKILAVTGERVCVLHQGGRRCWQSADTLRTRYQPAGEAGASVRFADVGPLATEVPGVAEAPSALSQGEALADGLGPTVRRVVEAQVPPLTEAPPRPQRDMRLSDLGKDEGTYSRPGMVILSRETGERVQRVATTLQGRLKGTGARVSVETLLDDTLTEEWAARLEGMVSP